MLDLDDDSASKSASVLLVTVWELGEAIGPLLIAPLSETLGRLPVLHAANAVFVSAMVLAALCKTTALFIAARALAGLAVTSNVLSRAIIGDMMPPEQRGSAMTILGVAPLMGGAVGPSVGGAIAQMLGWRQLMWMSAALASTCSVLLVANFRETYQVAAQHCRVGPGRGEGPGAFWEAVARPAHIFRGSGIIKGLCLFHGMGFTVYYIISVTLPAIARDEYARPVSGICGTVLSELPCVFCFHARARGPS